MNNSLTVKVIRDTAKDYYITDASKPYTGLKATDNVCIKPLKLCQDFVIHPIIDVRKKGRQTPLEDESILGYAGLMPKIREADGTVDPFATTILMLLKN